MRNVVTCGYMWLHVGIETTYYICQPFFLFAWKLAFSLATPNVNIGQLPHTTSHITHTPHTTHHTSHITPHTSHLSYSGRLVPVLNENLNKLLSLGFWVVLSNLQGNLINNTSHPVIPHHTLITPSSHTSPLALVWSHDAPNSNRILAVSILNEEDRSIAT